MPCFVSAAVGSSFVPHLRQPTIHTNAEPYLCRFSFRSRVKPARSTNSSILFVPVSSLERSGKARNLTTSSSETRKRSRTALSNSVLYKDRVRPALNGTQIQDGESVSLKVTDLESISAPLQSIRKNKRKPHGYWNDLGNVQRELLLVNASLGRRGRKQMPRLAEMKALGRGDLVAALAKYGGSKKVAAVLRWGPFKKSGMKLPTSLRTESKLPYTKLRPKEPRRSADYWDDLERVHLEVSLFIRQHSIPDGVMPTQAQFRKLGRADIVNGFVKHGGLRSVAASMNLRCTRSQATIRFDFESFAKQVLLFAKVHCPGKMPTAAELKSHGAWKISNAMTVHGGYLSVARRLNLELRSSRKQKAANAWNLDRLKNELQLFTKCHYPESDLDCMPTERQLRSIGRNDLSYAIGMLGSMNGGKKRLASLLGMKLKKNRLTSLKRPPTQLDPNPGNNKP